MQGSEPQSSAAWAMNLELLRQWMDHRALGRGMIEHVKPLKGGTQNLLFRFEREGRPFVLRRPSTNPRPGADELMLREARVLAALATSDVPHPGLIAACADRTVMGAAFYLMEAVEGFNATETLPEQNCTPHAQRAMAFALVDAIVALGAVDYTAVGLSDFGRPGGFLERQVSRWTRELDGYSMIPEWPGRSALPDVRPIERWLEANRPLTFSPGVMHGDYHIGNVMFRDDEPTVAAVIDWELSTIGDPLLDLAWLIATWPDDDGAPISPTLSVRPWIGFPREQELVDRYRERSERETSALDWYVVLACYKLGVILEGSHVRACAGQADRDMGQSLHGAAINLFDRARRRIG